MATILIAEDDVHIRQVTTMWLTRAGHQILVAQNGEQAKQLLQVHDVDLLVTDMHMPELTGMALITWWRTEAHSDQPIILLTSTCDPQDIFEGLKGYDVQIYAKPFSPARLCRLVEEALTQPQRPVDATEESS